MSKKIKWYNIYKWIVTDVSGEKVHSFMRQSIADYTARGTADFFMSHSTDHSTSFHVTNNITTVKEYYLSVGVVFNEKTSSHEIAEIRQMGYQMYDTSTDYTSYVLDGESSTGKKSIVEKLTKTDVTENIDVVRVEDFTHIQNVLTVMKKGTLLDNVNK